MWLQDIITVGTTSWNPFALRLNNEKAPYLTHQQFTRLASNKNSSPFPICLICRQFEQMIRFRKLLPLHSDWVGSIAIPKEMLTRPRNLQASLSHVTRVLLRPTRDENDESPPGWRPNRLRIPVSPLILISVVIFLRRRPLRREPRVWTKQPIQLQSTIFSYCSGESLIRIILCVPPISWLSEVEW